MIEPKSVLAEFGRSEPDNVQAMHTIDGLTITFLVDNCIEWMTKLPPEFTHELPEHLRLEPYPDEKLGVPVLNFENFCCGAHGFAVLIETELEENAMIRTFHTLFDTGPDSISLVRNIKGLQIPIDKITRVVTSHWHSDHTGGLLSFLRLQREQVHESDEKAQCIVDVHPDRPMARGIAPGPKFDRVVCAIPCDPHFDEIQEAGGLLETHAEAHEIAEGTVWISGEIPRVTEWEKGLLAGRRWVEEGHGGKGKWVEERHIMDERYAVVNVKGKGLVIFSSCSHAGIVNVVKDAVTKFQTPIYMIIGGLHLAGSEFSPQIPLTAEFLSNTLKPAPTYILPMHCTGFQAKIALEKAFGEGCVPAGVGMKVNIRGYQVSEKHMFPPVFGKT